MVKATTAKAEGSSWSDALIGAMQVFIRQGGKGQARGYLT